MIRRKRRIPTGKIPLENVGYEIGGAPREAIGAPVVPLVAAKGGPAAAGTPRVAVITVHGMGQQVPFETLVLVAKGLARADGQDPPDVTAANCRLGDRQVRRLRLPLTGARRTVEAHLYEVYWAPMTEGNVTLRDVLRFLVRDAWRTVLEMRKPFMRWVFESRVLFPKPLRSIFGLFAAILVLISLAILNVVAPLVAVGRLLEAPVLSDTGAFFRAVTLLMDVVIVGLAAALATLWLARVLKARTRTWTWLRRTVEVLALVLLFFDLVALALLPLEAALLWRKPSILDGLLSADVAELLSTPTVTAATWFLLVVLTLVIRRFLVQYVGDVAAYVSPQALDRFAEIRQKIKDEACTLARAVLSARTKEGDLVYESVSFVGHSLGSVIAYDAVNRMMTDDAVGIIEPGVDASRRIRTLLTFGSPLDKTAFVFGLHGRHADPWREMLAARVQPLIEDYAHRRTLRWINVHSLFDVVSGPLEYYDDEKSPAYSPLLRVQNERDREARIPLVAHTEYWTNDQVWKLLHGALV